MSDTPKTPTPPPEVNVSEIILFKEPPTRRQFFGVNMRLENGDALFPKDGTEVSIECTGWEWYEPKGKAKQIALVLKASDGAEYLKPLGPEMQYALRRLGYADPNKVKDHVVTFKSHMTGKSAPFQQELLLVNIE